MERLVRRHGLDLVIVVGAFMAFVEEVDESVAGAFAVLALVLPLLARHRSPFLAPAWLWLLAAALSFADGRLVVSSAGVYAAGMVSALLLGPVRDERQGRIGLAILVGSAVIIALNDPGYTANELVLIPATFALAWLGGYAMRERAAAAAQAEERAEAAERERDLAARIAVAEER